MSTVKMIQVNKGKWEIVTTEKGIILQTDLFLRDAETAGNYVKNYCSSFLGWTYEVVPLPKEDKDEKK